MPSEDPSNIDASTHHDSPDLTDSQATIPLTPEYYGSCNHYMIGAGHEHNDDFARLIPVNESACIAFDDLAAKFKRDYYWNKHARQYVHIDETKKDIQFIPSESDTETESPKESISRWTGYYRFSLSIPPRDIRLGWPIGSGRQDQVVDLLLTDKHRQYQIRGIHARVTHKSSSNVLLIMTDHKRKITLNGTQEIEGNQRVLWDWETGVTIGDLVYKLQLLKVDEHEYQEQLLQLRKTAGIYTHEPPITLDPTPSEKKYLYSDYIIDKPFDSGSTCTVLSGVHKITGVAYAVKKIVRTSKNSALIKWEVDVMKAIGSHVKCPYE